ncbi:hypothetical protein [Alteromonas sp. KUL49]|uniref:hypothetical protein n=1 Tax=Alteromonas sp. KUL49 TaxID=2480798 RepID=UPI00102EE54D|nr:hypothetical protein [Alteromonas sp. KUL49]TAP38727.1 hypothetical protein EYS00_15100 [Alteromonas sp. KUL49]GEA12681.1 hypothetical protein KUL49_30560 [Alteromonas sp. KUL49]
MRFNEKVILLAEEATYGTGASLSSANYQRVFDLNITPEGEEITDEAERGYEGAFESIPHGEHVSISYKTHLFGSGTAGTPPPFASALLACRLAEVIDPGVSVTYVLASDMGGSAAATVRIGNNLHEIAGMRGMVEIVFEKGVPKLSWQFKGLWQAPSHTAAAMPAVDNSPWLNFVPTGPGRTTNASLHGQSVKPFSLSLNPGNEPVYDESLTTAEILFSGRNGSGKGQIEAPTLDVINFFERASDRSHGPLSISHGPVGSRATVACPNVQIKKPVYTKLDSGNVGYDIDFVLLPNAGNDEFSLMFD